MARGLNFEHETNFNRLKAMRYFAWVILAIFTAGIGRAEEPSAKHDFPFSIQTEIGTSAFLPGDTIQISRLRGDRPHIEPGGTYLVEGTYQLSTTNRANLVFYTTTAHDIGPTAIKPTQKAQIIQGTGHFALQETMTQEGWLHVSFYVSGEPSTHGGVYFGEKGQEKTILRTMNWSYLSNAVITVP